MVRMILAAVAGCLLAPLSPQDGKVKTDKDAMQGKWKMVAGQSEGKKLRFSDEELHMMKLHIKGNLFIVEYPPGDVFGSKVVTWREHEFTLDESKKPKTIDCIGRNKEDRGKKALGIYSLEDNRLRICFSEDGKTRPTDFTTKKGSGRMLNVYEREKP